MRWDEDTLRLGLADNAPIFFVLTNTRALTPEKAESVTREVCHNLKTALTKEGIEDFLVVSRSDSTLRGHYPIETDVIAEELGGFDAPRDGIRSRFGFCLPLQLSAGLCGGENER